MAKARKKLSTGPINIPTSVYTVSTNDRKQKDENKILENQNQESRVVDSRLEDSITLDAAKGNAAKGMSDTVVTRNPNTRELDSGKQDSGKQENYKHESVFQESRSLDNGNATNENMFVHQPESLKQDSGKQESYKIDSAFAEVEYKKVAMRLSADAVEKLRMLKLTTGIPYEVLVDSVIKNWDLLPTDMLEEIIDSAKEERIRRLVAGQEKAAKTVRKRLEEI